MHVACKDRIVVCVTRPRHGRSRVSEIRTRDVRSGVGAGHGHVRQGELGRFALRALERGAPVAPLFVAMEQGRSDRMTSSPSFMLAVLNSSMACCGKGSGASRTLLEDRARAALSFFPSLRAFCHRRCLSTCVV